MPAPRLEWPDLPPGWSVEVECRKSPFGRRVIVRLMHTGGRSAEDSIVGGLRKSDRDYWTVVLLRRLVQRLGLPLEQKTAAPRVIGKKKRRRR